MSSKRSKRSKKSNKPRKRTKFISLKNHLSPPSPSPSPTTQQHPGEPMEENDSQVACLLEQHTVPDGGATITDLFGSSASSSSAAVDDGVLSPASPNSVECDGDGLARRALRGRERSVFCRSMSEEVEMAAVLRQGLQLKLDYEEILSAWSDRGSLYIDGEGPQVVPELRPHVYEHDSIATNVFVEVGNGRGWRVPEMEAEGKERSPEVDKSINREERVMRYKAKRQSRLFSKRIRYEVRKLNAEKRPRIKGRFVKRVDKK